MTYSEVFWQVTCKISGHREAVMHAEAPYYNFDGLKWRQHVFLLKGKLYLDLKGRNIASDAK